MSPALPAGVSLNTSTGEITGIFPADYRVMYDVRQVIARLVDGGAADFSVEASMAKMRYSSPLLARNVSPSMARRLAPGPISLVSMPQ